MAVVRKFIKRELDRAGGHTEAEATLACVELGGEKFIQIDTYGSKNREMQAKVSQSVRLSQFAFAQLKTLAEDFF